MSKDNSLTVLDSGLQGSSKDIQEALQTITDRHTEISNIKTPKAYQYKKQNFDYVKIEYMRGIANKYFPTHSWEIISHHELGSEAYVVHGRLTWHEEANGVMIKRIGDMVAAHRIQKLQGTNKFSDIGNDVKAANTDTLKKAYNMYFNIADDVYRNQYQEIELSANQKKTLLLLAKKVGIHETIKKQIENNEIHGRNYSAAIAKLTRKEKENESV